MSAVIPIVIGVVIIAFIAAIVIIRLNRTPKTNWTCNQNTFRCEKDEDGEYASKDACVKHCKKDGDIQQAMTEKTQQQNSYNCINCSCQEVSGTQGTYTTPEACQQNCCNLYNIYNPYYPQSMYSPFWRPFWDHSYYRPRHHRGEHRRRK